MHFMLIDITTGNAIGWYRDEAEARAALAEIVAEDPTASDEVALLTYDDEGKMLPEDNTQERGEHREY